MATREVAMGYLQGQAVANEGSLLLSRVKMGNTTAPHWIVLPGAQRKAGTWATVASSLPTLSWMCPPGTCASCWAFRCDGGAGGGGGWVRA